MVVSGYYCVYYILHILFLQPLIGLGYYNKYPDVISDGMIRNACQVARVLMLQLSIRQNTLP